MRIIQKYTDYTLYRHKWPIPKYTRTITKITERSCKKDKSIKSHPSEAKHEGKTWNKRKLFSSPIHPPTQHVYTGNVKLIGHSRDPEEQTCFKADPKYALISCKQAPGEGNNAYFQMSESLYLLLHNKYTTQKNLWSTQKEKRENKNIMPESFRLIFERIRITTDFLRPMPAKGK